MNVIKLPLPDYTRFTKPIMCFRVEKQVRNVSHSIAIMGLNLKKEVK